MNTYGEEHEAIPCKNTGADSEGHNNNNDDAQDGLEDAKHCCPSGVIKDIWTTVGHCEWCQPYKYARPGCSGCFVFKDASFRAQELL